MVRIFVGLFLIALTTLMLELNLIRIFDVIWYPNKAYFVVTLTMFSFGLAGVYYAVRPLSEETDVNKYLATHANLFGLFSLSIYPILNTVPFTFSQFSAAPVKGWFFFGIIFIALALPFFFAGSIFTVIFTHYAKKIRVLYFFDLVGAALGCYIIVPLIPLFGTGGILLCGVALTLWSSALFNPSKSNVKASVILGCFIILIPLFLSPDYLEFKHHGSKRALKFFKNNKMVERTYWDPISKIDVVSLPDKKFLAYDGGTQSSYIYPFDGDYKKLRSLLPQEVYKYSWGPMVWVSHYLKRDSEQNVLVIGSAGGQEIIAALTYGAAHVDAIELVEFVVKAGKTIYGNYNGGIYNHPNVFASRGEGRSFFRSKNTKYDIIQIFSNHTSSSIAMGTGAMSSNFLQTVEAYEDYFSKLNAEGVLHINHHIYPRMITTAAKAWRNLGYQDFQKHVVVFQKQNVVDTLPTMLVKMSPWTENEISQIAEFMGKSNKMVANPLKPKRSFLTPDFFSGNLPDEIVSESLYRISPPTDNKPFFNLLRKNVALIHQNPENFLNYSTAGLLNSQLSDSGRVPMEFIHLIVTSIASIFFAALFIFVPLYFSKIGRSKWDGKNLTLIYFSCLGAGFIILELVFIQIFMKFIGYPLYTYSAVVCTLLIGAGIGSLGSEKLDINLNHRWHWPFLGILFSGGLLLLTYNALFDLFLGYQTSVRILIAAIMIFPIGFFLGMPFPLGISYLKNLPAGAIGWAWGMNALFTVIGGVASVIFSIMIGFQATIMVALIIYCIAFILLYLISRNHGKSLEV